MIAHVVSGGPSPWLDLHELKDPGAFIIGVDRGVLTLLEHGVVPMIAVGDFDSVTESEYEMLLKHCPRVIKLESEKDETDTEIGIFEAIKMPVTEVRVYGGLGGRMDHSLANIRLLLKFVKLGIAVELVNETNRLRVLGTGSYEFSRPQHVYLSFFALEKTVTDLTLTGVKYPLTAYELQQSDIRCISNEVVADRFQVKFTDGFLLMINSQD